MRKLLLIGAMGALLALLVSACGGSSGGGGSISVAQEGEGGAKSVNAACEEEPVAGGNLTYARQLEVVTLNPLEIKNGNGDIFADEMLYSGLVRNDPNGEAKVVPSLAEKWDVSKDGMTYTFHLRPGIKFSDGSPITAEDVAWNLEQFANPKVNISLPSLAEGIKKITAPDKSTVVVELEYPVAAFLYNIAVFPAFIVPKAKVEAEGEAFWKHPISSGPFIMKEFASRLAHHLRSQPVLLRKGQAVPEDDAVELRPQLEHPGARPEIGRSADRRRHPVRPGQSLQGESNLAIQQVELPQEVLMVTNTKVTALERSPRPPRAQPGDQP